MAREIYFNLRNSVLSINDDMLGVICDEFYQHQMLKFGGIIEPNIINVVEFFNSVDVGFNRSFDYFNCGERFGDLFYLNVKGKILRNTPLNYDHDRFLGLFRVMILDSVKYVSEYCTHCNKKGQSQDANLCLEHFKNVDFTNIELCKLFVCELLSFAACSIYCAEFRHRKYYKNVYDQIWDLWRFGDIA